MFIDEIKVYARAGHGGKGAVAFHREAYVPKGGPSGGNGGRGGSVILQADHDLNNLIGQFYVPRLIAQVGQAGMGKGCDGLAGKDLIVKVPCGTLVWQLPSTTPPTYPTDDEEQEEVSEKPLFKLSTDKRPTIRVSGGERAMESNLAAETDAKKITSDEKGELVADLTTHGQQFVLCKGGRGGLGNRNFATARHQTPRFAQPGEPGEQPDAERLQARRARLHRQHAERLVMHGPVRRGERPVAVDEEVRRRADDRADQRRDHVVDVAQLDEPGERAEVERGGEHRRDRVLRERAHDFAGATDVSCCCSRPRTSRSSSANPATISGTTWSAW